jgi:ferredoxin-NADP reductase
MFAATPLRLLDLTRNLGSLPVALASGVSRRVVPALDRASTRVSLENDWLELALSKLDPTLSLRHVRARVVAISDETADTKTYLLSPNARFGGFRPGSFVTLRLRIDGQPVQRSYSISSAPRSDGMIAITVKRVPGGRVSNWLADTLRPGHVLELSAAQGQFLLPSQLPPKLLLLSAGSGATPVMSMLRQLVAADAQCQVLFMHFARTPHDIIFRAELERIAALHRNVRVEFCVESGGDERFAHGLFSEALLTRHAPEFRALDTFLCGPPGFMQAVMQCYERADADMSKLRYERFNVELDPSQFLAHAHLIRFLRSGAESIGNRPRTILEAAESAGLAPRFGCRAGNCGSCRCRKQSGVVVDITTGIESAPDAGFIYPCISVARGNVEVDL